MQNNTLNNLNGQLLIKCFSTLTDPRVRGRVSYPLIEIIIISICAILCGANQWKMIAEFGRQREDWFKGFLALENGVPSHQTIGRVFSLICPEQLLDCFSDWIQATTTLVDDSIIAIDGKTVRKSGCKSASSKPLHLINAYDVTHCVTMSSIKTPDKSNEIKGIPPLLKKLPIEKKVITIDAMGAQKGIVKLIRLRQANYCIALKKNHKKFYSKVDNLFKKANEKQFNAMVFKTKETHEYEHSRIEERRYCFLPIMYLPWLKEQWKDLETLIQLHTKRILPNGEVECAIRYYFSSLPLKKFELIALAIREHWAIENKLHYKLDVGLLEDQCRIFHPFAAENFSTLRKLVLYCLQHDSQSLEGITLKRWKALLDVEYLNKVIGF